MAHDKNPGSTPTVQPNAPSGSKNTRTVSEWSKIKFPPIVLNKVSRSNPDVWKHAAAAALHCWAEHRHHANEEMALSEQDYDAAIVAVCAKKPPYKPHKAALSKHAKIKKPKKAED